MVTLTGASVGGMTVYAKEAAQTTVSKKKKKGAYKSFEYAVYYRKNGANAKSVCVKDFSKSPDAVVTLKTASSYWIDVCVRDKAGNKVVNHYFVGAAK